MHSMRTVHNHFEIIMMILKTRILLLIYLLNKPFDNAYIVYINDTKLNYLIILNKLKK